MMTETPETKIRNEEAIERDLRAKVTLHTQVIDEKLEELKGLIQELREEAG